jgi:hypothetical protein
VSGKMSGKPVISVPRQATPRTIRHEAGVLGTPLEARATR